MTQKTQKEEKMIQKIIATNETLKSIVETEIEKLGIEADLNHIDVSRVTNMRLMFYNSQFNGNISAWDVSNVTNMRFMFSDSQFNGDLSAWNVSNVTNMRFMFYDSQFNGDLSKWNVSNVTDMNYMFWESPLELTPPAWYKV